MTKSNSFSLPNHELEFSFVRSSGAGGQNVNKVSSKAVLRWNIWQSQALGEQAKMRFVQLFKSRLSADGFVTIASQRFRDQGRNKQDCLNKLTEMVNVALQEPKPRKRTRVPPSAQRRRLEQKKRRSQTKRFRQGKD